MWYFFVDVCVLFSSTAAHNCCFNDIHFLPHSTSILMWFWIFIIILKLMFWILFTCCVLKWNDTRVILPQHHQEIHNTNTRIGIALRRNISWLKQCAWVRTRWHTTCKFCCLHRAVLVLMINEYDIFREDQKGSYYAEFNMKFLVSL